MENYTKRNIIKKLQKEMDEVQLKELGEASIQELLPEIRKILDRLSKKRQRPIAEHVYWRVKSSESITNKMLRKKKEVSLKNSIKTLHDILAIRIVCPFQDDVYAVCKAITNDTQLGLDIKNVKDFIAHPKSSGYRSIHIITTVHHPVLGDIDLEIQLRSVAMNYWAILDHQLYYKNENKQVQALKEELRGYAIEIANIDKKFYKIRKQIEQLEE